MRVIKKKKKADLDGRGDGEELLDRLIVHMDVHVTSID